jgi:hypothetical protein
MNLHTQRNLLVLFLIFVITVMNAQEKPKIKDDPAGRIKYETKRLIDPATGKIPDNIRERELEFASRIPGRLKSASCLLRP